MSGLRRKARNAGSLLTSDVVNRATTFVLYALVARHLGAMQFGQLSLALALIYVIRVFSGAGLKTMITREVAKDKNWTDQYLVNGSAVTAVLSVISIIALWLFVTLMNYSSDTASIIIILALGVFPYSMSLICEAIFQAWERMHYIAYATIPVNVLKVILAFFLLQQGYGLYQVVILVVASQAIILCAEWYVMLNKITKPSMKIDLRFALVMTKASSTFIGIEGIIAIAASLNIVLLSKLASETLVGLYSAAIQLLVPVGLVYQSIGSSVFPMMSRSFDSTFQRLRQISDQLIELLLVIAIPSAIGIFILADSMLLLLYRMEDFLLASQVLRIMVWSLILMALVHALGAILVAGLRERVTLRIVAINMLINLILGLILISRFGLIGAAVTALITGIANFLQHYISVSRLFFRIPLGRLSWKAIVASMCMAAYLALARSQTTLLVVITAGVVYIGVLLVLAIWSTGSIRQFKVRYLQLWSE